MPVTSSGVPATPEVNRFVGQAYLMTGAAVGVTALTAGLVTTLPMATQQVMFTPALLCQLILAFAISFVRRASGTSQLALLTTLAAFEGIMLGLITSAFGPALMFKAAAPAALTLGVMGWYGMNAKRDVLEWRQQLFIGLLCMLAMSVMNFFFSFGPLDWLFSLAGIALFAGLAAYDTRMLREQAMIGFENPDRRMASMVQGSTQLYLDFLNLLLFFLRLFTGGRGRK